MASSSSSSPEFSSASANAKPSFRPSEPKYTTLTQVVDDLSSRFILNLPDDELDSLERICFQVEQAHWFYEDFVREANPSLPSLPLKKFSELLFTSIPVLQRWSGDHEGAFNHFMQYKTRVPVCGAIMLNTTWDKVVLVKGWKASAGWGFPKGKINESEERHACAVREVLEETGYNLTGQIDPDDVIEVSIREQQVTLFIVPGIPEDFPFETKTRKEISKIDWFRLSDLPTWRRNRPVAGKFYLISPFIGALKAFISKRKPRHLQNRRNGRQQSYQTNQDSYMQEESDSSAADTHNFSASQENGSQTSSADTGDPQTPSPLYSEPVVHTASEPGHMEGTGDPAILAASMDPQLARLLSGLSLSAAAATSSTPAVPDPLASMIGAKPSVQTITPVPPLLVDAASSPDWSIRQPRKSRESPYQKPSRDVTVVGAISSKSSDTVRGPRSCSPHSPHSPPSSALSVSDAPSSASSVPNSAGIVSKRSSRADISPYTSHAAEQPVNGKRLRQLALLESVVDESARMTPILGQRATQPASPIVSVPSAFPPLSHPPPPFPPSTSVPPPNLTSANNLSAMYQHTPANARTFSQTIYQTLPSNSAPGMVSQDEAFVVRPRTSNTFRPIPPPSSRHFGARASMSQAQLLGILSNAPVPPVPPMPTQHGMFRGEMPGVPPMFGPPAMDTASTGAYAVGRATPASSANLLNILNSRGPSVPPPPRPQYAQYAGLAPQ